MVIIFATTTRHLLVLKQINPPFCRVHWQCRFGLEWRLCLIYELHSNHTSLNLHEWKCNLIFTEHGHITWVKYKPVSEVVHGFWFARWTTRLTNRSDGVVVPKLFVLIKLFFQDVQEHILVLMGAVEKVPLSQVTEDFNPKLSPNGRMTTYTMFYHSAERFLYGNEF